MTHEEELKRFAEAAAANLGQQMQQFRNVANRAIFSSEMSDEDKISVANALKVDVSDLAKNPNALKDLEAQMRQMQADLTKKYTGNA